MVLILLFSLLAPKECSLKVSPNVSIAPLKFLHLTIHIENPSKWWIGTIFIVDPEGELVRHQLFEGDMALRQPKTVVEDWKSLSLEEGVYEVQLVLSTREGERCISKENLQVDGIE